MTGHAHRGRGLAALLRGALLALFAIHGGPAIAAAARPVLLDQVDRYRSAHEREILGEFVQLLSRPNVATDIAAIEDNAAFIRKALERRGFATRLLSAGPGTPPAIYGELGAPGATRTIVLYAHYDGQPVSQSGWRSDPFKPVIRSGRDASQSTDVDWRTAASLDPDWRVYARSASDDKAPIQALLTAMDALRDAGRRPGVNIKLFLEGEEEQSSPHLEAILQQNALLLSGDLFVLSDGPRLPTGAMQLLFGARGTTELELTVYGPARPLHDGHYGNWAPNPAVLLTHLLDSLRDEDGRILVPGFYDDVRPLTKAERLALDALPGVERQLKDELALGRSEGTERLANSLMRPALNIRGIAVGNVGERASNTIFPEARASIDFRLVPGEKPTRVKEMVERYLRRTGWTVVNAEPTLALRRASRKVVKAEWKLGYEAYRADLSSPAAQWIEKDLEPLFPEGIVKVPMIGGSAPMAIFASALHMPIIGLPVANYDNNQHAANENLRLGNLWDAIDIYACLLTSCGSGPSRAQARRSP